MDVDSFRDNAERFYERTGNKFKTAKTTEENAREACLQRLKAAYDAPPDFRANSKDAATIIAGADQIGQGAEQAKGDANVALSGSGPKTELDAFNPNAKESPTLKRFRAIAQTLPETEESRTGRITTTAESGSTTTKKRLTLPRGKPGFHRT